MSTRYSDAGAAAAAAKGVSPREFGKHGQIFLQLNKTIDVRQDATIVGRIRAVQGSA